MSVSRTLSLESAEKLLLSVGGGGEGLGTNPLWVCAEGSQIELALTPGVASVAPDCGEYFRSSLPFAHFPLS